MAAMAVMGLDLNMYRYYASKLHLIWVFPNIGGYPKMDPPGNNHYRMVGLEGTRNLKSKVILYFHKGSCPGIF